MKICQQHWDKLRAKINEAGLGKFGANSGEQVVEIIKQHIHGDGSSFDPLLNANFAIWGNFLSLVGIRALSPDDTCPLCYLDEFKKNGCGDPTCTKYHEDGDDWIEFSVRDQIEEARQRGLLGSKLVN